MNCERIERMLSDYLDNSLKASEKKEVEAHLAKCQKCMHYLETITKVDNLIKLKTKEEPSKKYWDSYWSRLKGKLERTPATLQPDSSPSKNRNPFYLFVPRVSLALNMVLIALVILTAGFLYRNSQQLKSLRVAIIENREKMPYSETVERVLLPAVSEQAIGECIRKQVKLFHEIRNMFPHTIKWIVTNNGEIDMGLASQASLRKAGMRKQVPIFLQFEIFCTSPSPKIVSSPKIMVLSGNEVNVKLTGLSTTDETIYQYHCFPLIRENGGINLTVRISLDNSILKTSMIVDEGKRMKVGSLRKGNAWYSVYVTVRTKGLNTVETEGRGV